MEGLSKANEESGNMTLGRIIEPKAQIEESRKRFSNAELKQLIVPVIIEQFLVQLVGLADTMMVSYAGEASVSGVSLVNQLNNVFVLVFTALASGGAVVVSQYIGSRDKKNGILSAGQLVMLMTVISVIIEVLLLLLGRSIFSLLFGRVQESVLTSGMIYMRISAWSFPFLAVYNACAGLYRSMGRTKTIMNVSICMNVINIAGNAVGIFVLHAGVAGVAYPSLLSRMFAAVCMLILSMNKRNEIFVEMKAIFCWKASMLKRICRIAAPNSAEYGLFQLTKVALSSIVALFGTVQIAANGVAQSFWSVSVLFCLAMGPVFITVIGQYMGAGDIEGADYYMKKLLRITYLGSFICNAAFLLIMPLLLVFYRLSSEVVRLVVILAVMHNVFSIILSPLDISLPNGLRAAGDAKYMMVTSIISSVICRVLLSILLGITFNMGVIGIAAAMICDWAIKSALTLERYRSGKWKNFKVI